MSEEGLRVLLVDDEASLRKPLARYLGNMYGYRVDTAANEEEAWERVLWAERPYDVALIDDLLIPKLGAEPEPIGIGLMARIQERCPETECIIFTGWGMDRALEALQAGAYRYLAKPLNLDELGMTIRMAAEQGRLRQERDLLSATLGISRAMLSELNVGKTLKVITEAVPKLVGAEACAVALLDHATGKVRYDPSIPLGDATVKWHRHLREVQLTKQITEMGEPFVLSDVAAEAKRVDENLRLAGVRSFAGVPIPGEPQNLGVLYAYSTQREAFGTHERRVLQLLAGQAAIALENARLFADTQRSAQCSEALYRTSHALSSYLEEEPVIRAILEAVYRTLGCEYVLISTVDDEAETIGIRHGIWDGKFDVFPEWIEMSQYSLDHPDILTDIYRTGRTEIIKGWDDRFNREIYDKFRHERILRIFMPIKTRDEVIGVVEVGYDKRKKGYISEDEVQLLAAFMDQATVALENARLFSQLSETKERLDDLIASSLDPVIAIDQDKKIMVFNRRAEEMFGWTAEEMEGRSVARLHVDFGKAQEIHEVVNREGTIAGWEIVLKHKDGTRIPVLLSATLIRDSQGNPIGQAGFMRDLRQVYLLEERLRALIGVSQAITVTLELDKVLDLIVESAVAAFPAAQSGAIHLYDERADTLRVRAITLGYSAEVLEALNLKVGEGIAGWVFQNQQPLVVDDTRQAPHYKRIDHPEVQVHRSMICVPLRVREQMIGTLSLDNSDVTGAFQPEDLGLLASFADQAAIAIDNARRMQELEQIRQAAEAMSRVFEPRQALQQIVESAVQVLQVDSAVIWSYDEVRHSFIPEQLVAVGIPPGELERFRAEEPKPGQTAETVMDEGYVTVTDVLQPDCDFLGQPTRELLNRIGVRSFQGSVLKVGDERLGVLYANYNRTRTFDEDDEARLRTFASHAALALKNAHLMAQMQRTRETAGVIAGVTLQEDLAQTLKTIVQHTQRVLRSDAVSLYSYDEATGQFGEWATEIVDPRDSDSAHRPEKLDPDSAVGTILSLEGPRYYHLAEDHADQDRLLAGAFVHVEGIQAAIGIQLRVGEYQVGVMFVSFRSPHRFTSDEIATIQLFADQAAVAIENARFYEGEQRRAREAEAMVQVGQAISSTLDLGRILETVAKNALSLLGLEDGKSTIFLVDEKTGDFVQATRVPPCKDGNGPRPSGGLTSLVIETGKPIVIPDVRRDSRVRASVVEKSVRSLIGMPLKVKERTIGVLFASTFYPRDFTQRDIEMLSSLANQAAVAIENAYLFGKQQQEAKQLALINQIAAEISSSLDLARILQTLVDELARVIGVEQCAMAIFDERGEYADVVAEYLEAGCVPAKGVRIPLYDNAAFELVRKTGRPLTVKDAQHDPRMEKVWHIMKQRRAQSIMIVPITIGGEVIGTIGLDAVSGPRDFTREEEWLAETIAHHAAIAVQNAQRYEELKRTKGLVGARTALAWMGMASSAWRHATDKHALTIREQIQLLREDLSSFSGENHAKIDQRLGIIERLARQILEKPIVPPLSTEGGVSLVVVNDLIGERARQLWENEPYRNVELQLELHMDETAAVRVSPEWLRRAFDVLVDNAVEAVADCEVRKITIGTRETDGRVEIVVSDTGPGMPEEILQKLFREPIEKPEDAKGLGMGLLMAGTIVQTYGGEIGVGSTGSGGTTMVIWLPLEK